MYILLPTDIFRKIGEHKTFHLFILQAFYLLYSDLGTCISVLLLLKDFIYLYLQYLLYTISRKRRIFKALEALFAFLLVQILRKIVLNGIKCAHENSFLSCGYFWHFIILNLHKTDIKMEMAETIIQGQLAQQTERRRSTHEM